MAFREVAVTEIREVLQAWQAGARLRRLAAQAGWTVRTPRRYVAAAVEAGLARDGGVAQLASIIYAATGPVHHLDTTPDANEGFISRFRPYTPKRPEGRFKYVPGLAGFGQTLYVDGGWTCR
jgi:hypothetical protein